MRVLEDYGYRCSRFNGDHAVYTRKGCCTITIPVRQKPLAEHIVKQALEYVRRIRELEDR